MKIGKREIKGKRVINWEIPSMCATTIIPSLSAHSYPPVPLSTSTKSTNSVGGIGKKERAIQKHQRSEVEIPQVFPNKHTCTCARLRLLSAVDSLKKKDAVSAAMLRSCSIPVSSTSQTPPPRSLDALRKQDPQARPLVQRRGGSKRLQQLKVLEGGEGEVREDEERG